MSTLNFEDAKAHLGAVIDAALSGVPRRITTSDRAAVVVIAASEYERLIDRSDLPSKTPAPGFIDHLLSIPREKQAPQRTSAAGPAIRQWRTP